MRLGLHAKIKSRLCQHGVAEPLGIALVREDRVVGVGVADRNVREGEARVNAANAESSKNARKPYRWLATVSESAARAVTSGGAWVAAVSAIARNRATAAGR